MQTVVQLLFHIRQRWREVWRKVARGLFANQDCIVLKVHQLNEKNIKISQMHDKLDTKNVGREVVEHSVEKREIYSHSKKISWKQLWFGNGYVWFLVIFAKKQWVNFRNFHTAAFLKELLSDVLFSKSLNKQMIFLREEDDAMRVIEFFVQKAISLEYRVHNYFHEWHYYYGGIGSNIQRKFSVRN